MNDAIDEINRRREAKNWALVVTATDQAWADAVEHYAGNREMLLWLIEQVLMRGGPTITGGPDLMCDIMRLAGLALIKIETEIRAREEESRDH